jgi:hypothetical protein
MQWRPSRNAIYAPARLPEEEARLLRRQFASVKHLLPEPAIERIARAIG